MSGALDFLTFLYQVNQMCQVYEEIKQKISDYFNIGFGVVFLYYSTIV